MAWFRPPDATAAAGWTTRLLLVAGVVVALYVGREIFALLALLLTTAALPAGGWMEEMAGKGCNLRRGVTRRYKGLHNPELRAPVSRIPRATPPAESR